MYLLATDYDGTFKKDNYNLYLNIDAINRFRSEGNKFAIVTGRSFTSIKKEIRKYSIDYDYISCNNGLIVFDNNDNILNKISLDTEIVKNILNELDKNKFALDVDKYGDYGKVYNDEEILEFSVKFKNTRQAFIFKKYIESKIYNIKCWQFQTRLFIGSNITKLDAVHYMMNLENLTIKDVYTIGDDINDLEMLKGFNGYKMLNCRPRMWLKNIPITQEVHSLVKKLSK